MNIHVTAQHIMNGQRADCRRCPVALALKDATGQRYAVSTRTYRSINDLAKNEDLPAKARDWIEAFDSGHKVKPFTFNIPKRKEPTP